MKKLKYFLLIFTFIMISCHYKKDKLIIINNSKSKICYETLIKYRNENTYYQGSVGGTIDINNRDSPTVKSTILYEIEKNSYNKILYIVFYNIEDREYVYKHINTIIFNKKFKVNKYSLKELDSMNWVVSYPTLRRVP